MITLELPINFCKNFIAIENAEKLGVVLPERDEYTTNCTFFVPEDTYIRVTETKDKANILIGCFDNESFQVDADYQSVVEIVKRAMKKNES